MPSSSPTAYPTTEDPTVLPTLAPTTTSPSTGPSKTPSLSPTTYPTTEEPTALPTYAPTMSPSSESDGKIAGDDSVEAVFQVDGVTEENKIDVCLAVANELGGVLQDCTLMQLPHRRILNVGTSTLIVTVAEIIAGEAITALSSDDFLANIESLPLPAGVEVLSVESTKQMNVSNDQAQSSVISNQVVLILVGAAVLVFCVPLFTYIFRKRGQLVWSGKLDEDMSVLTPTQTQHGSIFVEVLSMTSVGGRSFSEGVERIL